ncbi:hypothetical protein [Streptomyces sp.]
MTSRSNSASHTASSPEIRSDSARKPFRLGPVRRRSLFQLLRYDIATHGAASPCQLITSNRNEA